MKRELTLGEQVLEIARKFPSHDALSFDGVNYSYSELSESVAQWFKALKDSKSYEQRIGVYATNNFESYTCLLYTSPSPRDGLLSRMPSSA